MSVFILGDLHLSLSDNKPMDVFSGRWTDYVEKIRSNWSKIVDEDDTVIVPGDISWAMNMHDAEADLDFISSLPGKKILLKGNHDYFWTSVTKIDNYYKSRNVTGITCLQNNAIIAEDFIICGTRGWYSSKEDAPENTDYDKMVARENLRFGMSLRCAMKIKEEHPEKELIAVFHFPPLFNDYSEPGLIDQIEKAGIRQVFFGHIHAIYNIPQTRIENGVRYTLVSSDYLNFIPYKMEKKC